MIPVKYTEEEAEYLSVRPVVRQTFRREELLDMLVSVAGKDVARLQQILRAGTTVYNLYRYWWEGVEAQESDLRASLARFPDADPSRPFRPSECSTALCEAAPPASRVLVEFRREETGARRLFRGQSFWERLMQLMESSQPAYRAYSYPRKGDLYEVALTADLLEEIIGAARRLATRGTRAQAQRAAGAAKVLLVCPRSFSP